MAKITRRQVGRHTVCERSIDDRDEQAGYIERWLECHCGEEVPLDCHTNTCDGCGADYNLSGQHLAPREQWGEETGEHPSECV